MRALSSIALLIGLVVCGAGDAGAGDLAAAKESLTDLLFSDAMDRIDFQATTFEEGMTLIGASTDTIFEMGMPILGDAADVERRGREVITALNASRVKNLYSTFGKDKQTLFVRNATDARMLGEIVGTTISIIHQQFGGGRISYQEKASKMFQNVQVDPDEGMSMVELYLDTVEFVEKLPSRERQKYFR